LKETSYFDSVKTTPNAQDIDDVASFTQLKECLKVVGINETQQMDIWKVLSGLLYLQNIQFSPGGRLF